VAPARRVSHGDLDLARFRLVFLVAGLATQSLWAGNEPSTAELHRELSTTIERIESVVADKSCYETNQCASLPVGHKACGGPSQIFTYSTAIGHDANIELLNLAEHSRQVQRRINEIEFAISDCSMRVPGPLRCHEGQCIELTWAYSQENLTSAKEFLASVIYSSRLAALSDRLSKREISLEDRQKILFQSALRISDCVLSEFTANPEPRTEPSLDAFAFGYDDQGIHERIAASYDERVADEQIEIIRPLLGGCVETEEMSVLSVYPRM